MSENNKIIEDYYCICENCISIVTSFEYLKNHIDCVKKKRTIHDVLNQHFTFLIDKFSSLINKLLNNKCCANQFKKTSNGRYSCERCIAVFYEKSHFIDHVKKSNTDLLKEIKETVKKLKKHIIVYLNKLTNLDLSCKIEILIVFILLIEKELKSNKLVSCVECNHLEYKEYDVTSEIIAHKTFSCKKRLIQKIKYKQCYDEINMANNLYDDANRGDFYILQIDPSHPKCYKIGISTKLHDRLKQYKTGSVIEPYLRRHFPCKNIKKSDKIVKNVLKKWNAKREIYTGDLCDIVETIEETLSKINGQLTTASIPKLLQLNENTIINNSLIADLNHSLMCIYCGTISNTLVIFSQHMSECKNNIFDNLILYDSNASDKISYSSNIYTNVSVEDCILDRKRTTDEEIKNRIISSKYARKELRNIIDIQINRNNDRSVVLKKIRINKSK